MICYIYEFTYLDRESGKKKATRIRGNTESACLRSWSLMYGGELLSMVQVAKEKIPNIRW